MLIDTEIWLRTEKQFVSKGKGGPPQKSAKAAPVV
jgi:hypothetical protein